MLETIKTGASTMTLREIVLHNKKLVHDHEATFQATFGVSLSSFWELVTGFDIVKFDKWLETPDGVSTHDYLLQKYDQNALTLVEDLLK
jgi:hypothetical protein